MNNIAVNIGDTFGSSFGTTGGKQLGDAVYLFLRGSYMVAGIIILFMLAFAGFKMVQSAGGGNQQDAEKAKQAATGAVVGFVLVFTSYWIIKIIEAITGYSFITKPF